jgi:hypothetical protein
VTQVDVKRGETAPLNVSLRQDDVVSGFSRTVTVRLKADTTSVRSVRL